MKSSYKIENMERTGGFTFTIYLLNKTKIKLFFESKK